MPRRPTTSTTQRGYGWSHQQERKRWKPTIDAGRGVCWRCGGAIQPGTPWDLGHDDFDRGVYRGPEHRACNRRAGARKGNRQRSRRAAPQPPEAPQRPPEHTSWRW